MKDIGKSAGNPAPYHGYFYKILKSQGPHAPRGEYDYVINGRMIGGFAMWHSRPPYGSSGIKTFIVNQDGVVYEKDLGLSTEIVVPKMTTFDPDGSWRRVESKHADSPHEMKLLTALREKIGLEMENNFNGGRFFSVSTILRKLEEHYV